jgi:hypothetical protein
MDRLPLPGSIRRDMLLAHFRRAVRFVPFAVVANLVPVILREHNGVPASMTTQSRRVGCEINPDRVRPPTLTRAAITNERIASNKPLYDPNNAPMKSTKN